MRIREAQQHTHPADPDPKHWILECVALRGSLSFLDGWFRPAAEKAKKLTQCFSCGDLNGVVKKCGLLKISHEKYRWVRQPGKSDRFGTSNSHSFYAESGPTFYYNIILGSKFQPYRLKICTLQFYALLPTYLKVVKLI